MTKIYQPHDNLFKEMMQRKDVAQEFFQSHLPPAMLAKVDLNHLILQSDTYVDINLKRSMTDILFQTKFSKKTGYLYILIEQQTNPEKMMPFRIFRYMFKIMENHLKKTGEEKLPVVYPILYHNGKREYPYSTALLDLFDDPEDLISDILFKPIQLIDLSKIEDEALQQKIHYGIMVLVMKKVWLEKTPKVIYGLIDLVSKLEEEQNRHNKAGFLTAIIRYIVETAEVGDPKETIEAIKELLTEQEQENVMGTLAQYWEQQGKEKGILEGILEGIRTGIEKGMEAGVERGIEKGIEKGMEKGKVEGAKEKLNEVARKMLAQALSISVISQVTGLTEEEIQALNIEEEEK